MAELETELSAPTEDSTPVAPPAPEPANNGPTPQDLENLRKALEAERKQNRQAQAQLKAFEGIDPDGAKRALEIAAKQQEWEEAQAKLKADTEAEIKSRYEPTIAQQQQQLAEAQQALADYKRDTQLERAFLEQGGFADGFEYARIDLQQRVRLKDNGSLEVLNAKGEPDWVADKGSSRPKTLGELIAELKATNNRFARQFKASDRAGFGINGNGMGTASGEFADLPAWERVNRMRRAQSGMPQ
jgi:multidrug efflux pump subunit AcrA (membrane-fusion protein)